MLFTSWRPTIIPYFRHQSEEETSQEPWRKRSKPSKVEHFFIFRNFTNIWNFRKHLTSLVGSESVFLSDNNTSVVAHRGSTTTLHCQVVKDSQYGVVRRGLRKYLEYYEIPGLAWDAGPDRVRRQFHQILISKYELCDAQLIYHHGRYLISLTVRYRADILTFQMTWSRLAEGSTPYTVLTIGDTKYINNERFAIEKPIRHDVSHSLSAGGTGGDWS